MNSIVYYFVFFLIYAHLGWIMETVIVFISQKKLVDRGFLIGPYCPIYGFAATLIILFLNQYKHDFLTLFILATVYCSILEYITSYLMEKIFKARWWDYSEQKYNLNGRITLRNSVFFGFLGFLLLHYIHPVVNHLVHLINYNHLIIIFHIVITLFIIDIAVSFVVIKNMKLAIKKIRSDLSDEIGKHVKDVVFKKSPFNRRILKAYPSIKLPNIKIRKQKKGWFK